MKRINILLLVALFFALTFFSCNKHDDDKTEPEKTTVENNSGTTNNSETNNSGNTDTPSNTEVTPEKVTVTFDMAGGTGTIDAQTVEKGTKITLPSGEGMEKDGYKFLGWSLTENGEIITEYTATESEVKLYAVWEQVIFTVKFDTDGGTGEFALQKIEKGKTATEPEIRPKKNGCIFVGWNCNDAKFDFSTAITDDVTITAQWIEISKNCIAGLFSVSETKKIFFSKGNLQYHCKNKDWRFAPNQYDRIFNANTQIPENYDGYIDFFGWGMWLEGQDPLQTVVDNEQYLSDIKNDGNNFTGKSAVGEEWKTLTKEEWNYLINKRGSEKIGVAAVNNIRGLVILPDDWTLPDGVTFQSGFADYFLGLDYYKTKNDYTVEQWNKMESVGAVFLPTAGYHFDHDVYLVDIKSYYWSATANGIEKAYCLAFSYGYEVIGDLRYYGQSVRLVRVVQN